MGIRQAQVDFTAAREEIRCGENFVQQIEAPYSYITTVAEKLSAATGSAALSQISGRVDEILQFSQAAKDEAARASVNIADGFGTLWNEAGEGYVNPTHKRLTKTLNSAQKRLGEGTDDQPGVIELINSVGSDFEEIQAHLNAVRAKLDGNEGEEGTRAKLAKLGEVLEQLCGLPWFPELVQKVFRNDPYPGDFPTAKKELESYQWHLNNR